MLLYMHSFLISSVIIYALFSQFLWCQFIAEYQHYLIQSEYTSTKLEWMRNVHWKWMDKRTFLIVGIWKASIVPSPLSRLFPNAFLSHCVRQTISQEITSINVAIDRKKRNIYERTDSHWQNTVFDTESYQGCMCTLLQFAWLETNGNRIHIMICTNCLLFLRWNLTSLFGLAWERLDNIFFVFMRASLIHQLLFMFSLCSAL